MLNRRAAAGARAHNRCASGCPRPCRGRRGLRTAPAIVIAEDPGWIYHHLPVLDAHRARSRSSIWARNKARHPARVQLSDAAVMREQPLGLRPCPDWRVGYAQSGGRRVGRRGAGSAENRRGACGARGEGINPSQLQTSSPVFSAKIRGCPRRQSCWALLRHRSPHRDGSGARATPAVPSAAVDHDDAKRKRIVLRPSVVCEAQADGRDRSNKARAALEPSVASFALIVSW